MKRHLFGTVGSLAAVLLMVGCVTDPTASLRGGGVETVVISRTYVEMDVGDVVTLNAKAYDAQGNVLPDLPTVTIDDDAVGDLTINTETSGDPLPQTDFEVEGISDGSIVVSATVGGVTATADIVVFPTSFPGTVALDATGAVDLLTVTASTYVKFDTTASTEVLINDMPTVLLSRTSEEIQVAVISASPLTGATVTLDDLIFQPAHATYDLTSLDAEGTVDIRTTLFDGTMTVDASKQADYVTIASSANFGFADDASVLIDGDPTFIVSRSPTQLVVAGSNIAAVTAGEVTIENALYLGQFDVASVVAGSTVNLEAFDNSVMTDNIGAAPDYSAGPFPLVIWGMVEDASPDRIIKFSPGSDLDMSSSVDWANGDTDIDVFYTDAGDGFVDCLGCGSSNPETGSWTVAGGDTNYFYVELWSGDPTVYRVTITSP